MAEVSADVEGTKCRLGIIGSLIQNVGPDGEVQPLDTLLAVAIAGAFGCIGERTKCCRDKRQIFARRSGRSLPIFTRRRLNEQPK
jgi:hypothetical protein